MPTPETPPVAFSLSAPLTSVTRAAFRRPLTTFGPVACLLLPLVPLAAGTQLVLDNGGSGAMQGLIAGAPAGRAGALIVKPDVSGALDLAALFALLTAILSVIVAAGLATGASLSRAAADRGGREPSLREAVGRSLAVWPAMLVAITTQLLLSAIGATAVIVLGVFAGRLQFQLGTVVTFLGLATLLMWLIRGSLWPATALSEDLPPAAALRRSWDISHGSVLRLLGAAFAATLAIGIPALIARLILKLILTALANAEVIGLSPLAIDLWALIPVPVGIFLISALWGREAPVLHDALIEQQRRTLADANPDIA